MKLEILKDKTVLILGSVTIFSALLTLNNIYFISKIAQNIYYIIYVILSSLLILILSKRYTIQINQGFLIPIIFLIIFIVYFNHIIAIPMLLIYPLFKSKNSKILFKIISGILYVFLVFIFISTVFVRHYFIADKLVYENTSPNGKYNVQVILVDQGALGGDIKVNLDKKYFNILKKERTIYNDRYWEEGSYIRWIGDSYIDINGTIIDIQSKHKIDKRL